MSIRDDEDADEAPDEDDDVEEENFGESCLTVYERN